MLTNFKHLKMGSFAGHVLPGSFLIIMGVWWTFNILHRYFVSLYVERERYKSTATFCTTCLPKRFQCTHWEAVLKIILCVVGMVGEMGTAYGNSREGYKFYYGNVQHTTMFFFFGFAGVFDLIQYHGAALPVNTDYMMMFTAFCVEGLLFYFHLDGRPDVDVHLHRLLIIAIGGCAVSTLFEIKTKTNVLLSLSRSCFVILQGTWFYQIAFVLYSPMSNYNWILMKSGTMTKIESERFHDQILFITCLFTWHAGAILMCIMFVSCAFKAFFKCTRRQGQNGRLDAIRLIKTDSNGQRFISFPTGEDQNTSGSDID